MPYLSIRDEVELRYDTSGSGERCWLLCNGASLPLEVWDPVAGTLAKCDRVVRMDQRNAGLTRAAGSFTLLDAAADAIRLLDHLEVDKVMLVGHAWGGRVAQVIARDFPHRIEGLVICGTGGNFPARVGTSEHQHLRDAYRSRDRKKWETALATMYFAHGFAARQPERFALVADLLWDQKVAQQATWDDRVAPSPSYWGTARVPTLLIYGSEDRFGTREHAEDLARLIPDARTRHLEGVGHSLVIEAPEPILESLLEFAADITRPLADAPGTADGKVRGGGEIVPGGP